MKKCNFENAIRKALKDLKKKKRVLGMVRSEINNYKRSIYKTRTKKGNSKLYEIDRKGTIDVFLNIGNKTEKVTVNIKELRNELKEITTQIRIYEKILEFHNDPYLSKEAKKSKSVYYIDEDENIDDEDFEEYED